MEQKKRLVYVLGGFVLGVLLTTVVWLCIGRQNNVDTGADPEGTPSENISPAPGLKTDAVTPPSKEDTKQDSSTAMPEPSKEQPTEIPDSTAVPEPSKEQPTEIPDSTAVPEPSKEQPTEIPDSPPVPEPSKEPPTRVPDSTTEPKPSEESPTRVPDSTTEPKPSEEPPTETPNSTAVPEPSKEPPAGTWDSAAVYTGGDIVSYQGRRYRAKWWTQGELPDSSDVWEDLGIVDGEASQPEGVDNVPVNAAVPQDTELTDFKVVGYYPSWKPSKLSSVDFSIVTHVCYAFAIPTADGGLRDLENPDTAMTLIRSAHDNGAKVLLSVGGWSYNDTPLESVFMEATADDAKVRRFAENILAMCEKYGFDGVDMDWEHPRVDGTSARQYEALMLALSELLHARGKLLTAAVLSGATADGNIYYDAAAHTNAVLNAVDFINIMAYDGGDGERHSQYQFAVDCGTYWKETRGLPAHKVVLGVPFYARPSWADYGTILASVPDAYSKDHVAYNGMDVYYNGVNTIAEKTRYARENLGGIMIWELTQDTSDASKSLLQAIGDALE